MDASYLPKINIRDVDHIQVITDSIRHLHKFNRSSYKRSITMPDRTPDALYKFFRIRTGPKYERTRRTDLYRRHHLLRPPPLYETHWQTLERWLKHLRPVDTELIGGTIRKRYNLYYPPKAKILQAVEKKGLRDCDCMPPCTCKWTNKKELRDPWRLKCLKDISLSRKRITGITLLKVHVPQRYALIGTLRTRESIDRLAANRSFTDRLTVRLSAKSW